MIRGRINNRLKVSYYYTLRKKRYKKKYQTYNSNILLKIICLGLCINMLTSFLINKSIQLQLIEIDTDFESVNEFYVNDKALMDIKRYAQQKNKDFYDILITCMNINDYNMTKWEKSTLKRKKTLKKDENYYWLKSIYFMILNDIKYFPIKDNNKIQETVYHYDDTWKAKRTYGGERLHYGTDIISNRNVRGDIPIISITDGIVEKKGWLDKGGYRLGIRAPSGAYFYYAHLDSYAKNCNQGDSIKAGQIIGYMGDTGYGTEGTTGMFPVHLHLGISLPIDDKKDNKKDESWVNPYWILKYLEKANNN